LIEELISRIFCCRNLAHIEHWTTDSYAQHVAFGDFYESVIEITDDLVEAYQGNFGRIGKVAHKEYAKEALLCLEATAVWLVENREEISKGVAALDNIVDELVGLHLSTIYKLKFLK